MFRPCKIIIRLKNSVKLKKKDTRAVQKVSVRFEFSGTSRVGMTASQRRSYCASENSHSPVGLVSRQWDAVDWACVLCDRHIHNDQSSRSASTRQCACPLYNFSVRFFWQSIISPRSVSRKQSRFGSLRLLAFPKAKIAIEREDICECDCHTVHKLSQRRLTADWLAPRESDCSRMHSTVSSDWLPSYITATRPVLEIFKMAGYFPHSLRIQSHYPTFSIQPCWRTSQHRLIFIYLNLF